ncbi:MAG: DUF6920 family protein [Vulcanimicrobiaceae bacterium]
MKAQTLTPPLVMRYMTFARVPAQPIRGAVLYQDGVLRATDEMPWMPFRAVEHFSINPISFEWDAWIRQNAVLRIRVCDHYKRGRGASDAKLGGVLRIASQGGTQQLAEASLVRFLAESAWLPTLMADPRIAWETVAERAARATLTDGAISASVIFGFAQNGSIATASAQRYREVGGRQVLTSWRGHYADYSVIDGMMVPTTAWVEWIPPESTVAVWRARITKAQYSF